MSEDNGNTEQLGENSMRTYMMIEMLWHSGIFISSRMAKK